MTKPPPKPRPFRHRLTDEMRQLKPGKSLLLSPPEANAFRAWAWHAGWKLVQRKEWSRVRVWRVEA